MEGRKEGSGPVVAYIEAIMFIFQKHKNFPATLL